MDYYTRRDQIYELCSYFGEGTWMELNEINVIKAKTIVVHSILQEIDKINKLYTLLYDSDLYTMLITKSGAISKYTPGMAYGAWNFEKIITKKGVFKGIKLRVYIKKTLFILVFGAINPKDSTLTGKSCYNKFLKACEVENIDLKKYESDKGKEIKETIESPIISFDSNYTHKVYENVNHIDIKSAWGSGVAMTYPEFMPVVEKLYKKDKLVMNLALGYCQSEYIDYKLSILAKTGIEWCNNKIKEKVKQIREQNFIVLGINTDGIWYKDNTNQNRLYTDNEENTGFGGWRTDHKNCKLFAYSDGQYWFEEDGKFNVRARGFYAYETIKPRELWNREDFDKAMSNQAIIEFDYKKGFIIKGE